MNENRFKTFGEKLDLVADLWIEEPMAASEQAVQAAEERLQMQFPAPLREFYLHFGQGGPVFSDRQNTLFSLEELKNYTDEDEDDDDNEDLTEEDLLALGGDLVLAEENQGVWCCRLDQETGLPYLDLGDGEREELNTSLEDTLLWLLAMNLTTDEMLCCGSWETEEGEATQATIQRSFQMLTDDPMTVFYHPERKVLGCHVGGGAFWFLFPNEDDMDELEEETGMEFDCF